MKFYSKNLSYSNIVIAVHRASEYFVCQWRNTGSGIITHMQHLQGEFWREGRNQFCYFLLWKALLPDTY